MSKTPSSSFMFIILCFFSLRDDMGEYIHEQFESHIFHFLLTVEVYCISRGLPCLARTAALWLSTSSQTLMWFLIPMYGKVTFKIAQLLLDTIRILLVISLPLEAQPGSDSQLDRIMAIVQWIWNLDLWETSRTLFHFTPAQLQIATLLSWPFLK